MESCRNALIEFVYREATAQIHNLGIGIKHKYNIDEVVTYALNRLPPMFASTDVGLQIKKQIVCYSPKFAKRESNLSSKLVSYYLTVK